MIDMTATLLFDGSLCGPSVMILYLMREQQLRDLDALSAFTAERLKELGLTSGAEREARVERFVRGLDGNRLLVKGVLHHSRGQVCRVAGRRRAEDAGEVLVGVTGVQQHQHRQCRVVDDNLSRCGLSTAVHIWT